MTVAEYLNMKRLLSFGACEGQVGLGRLGGKRKRCGERKQADEWGNQARGR